jgi:DNA-binding SARP family transcriptional activator
MRKPATLSVQVLGPFAVARDGVTVPAHELASRKGRTLLKLLVARRGAVVPADVIVETLWGDRPPADPDANLATLVSRLRSVLGADAIAGTGTAGTSSPAAPRGSSSTSTRPSG